MKSIWKTISIVLSTLLVGGAIFLLGVPQFSTSEAIKDKPSVQVQDVAVVEASKLVIIVPGDIITESTPFESVSIDCTGYTVANLIMHVKNLSTTDSNKFFARATFGPIGSLAEVEVITYNRPLAPLQSFVWRAVVPVYASNFKVYYSMTGFGSIDINNAAVLGTGSAPNP